MLTFAALLLAAPQNPLEKLPSQPGPHLEAVEALPDGGWAELGAPAPDPAWGRARGRSWSGAMAYAPELRGAFLYGEGVHGYVKPDGRYMDDLWLYDIAAHRWICLYPGADPKTLQLTLNADGFEAGPDGRPVPVAAQVHAYAMIDYDPERRRFVMMPCPGGYEKKAMPQRAGWLKPPPPDASPWFFESASGAWNRVRTSTPGPRSGFGDVLLYLPGRTEYFFGRGGGKEVWFFDAAKNAWRQARPSGPPPPFGIEPVACVDPVRDRVYVGGGNYPRTPDGQNAFWIYDLKADAWIDPKPKGAPCRGSTSYTTLNATMVFDAAADRVLLLRHSSHYDKEDVTGVYVYDPTANAWAEEVGPLPEKLSKRSMKNGFYDPALRAVFLHSAGDSADNGTIWAYRYRRGGK